MSGRSSARVEESKQGIDDDDDAIRFVDRFQVQNQRHLFLTPPSMMRRLGRNSSLSFPTRNKKSDISPPGRTSSKRGSSSNNNTTPFLTVALLELDQLSEKFCQLMAKPTYANACQACACLSFSGAAAAAAAATAKGISQGSPRGVQSTLRPSSPTKSPLLNWISSSNAEAQHPHSSTLSALEQELEEFQRPFFLFAAAEVMYADLRHLEIAFPLSTDYQKHSKPASLCSIYRLVQTELMEIRRKLCVPFLVENPNPSNENKYSSAASSLSKTLISFVDMCHSRAILIDAQYSMFAKTAQLYDDMRELVDREIITFANHVTSHAFRPIQLSFDLELQAWKRLLAAAWSLDRCLFLESIVNLRQLKKYIIPEPIETRIYKWMIETLRSFQSLLPIYFDRVNAFSGPLYGFDSRPARSAIEGKNWSGQVLSFLRKQEKLGGPDTVVAVVLDAAATNNLNFERGFVLSPTSTLKHSSQQLTDNMGQHAFDIRVLWPAVYMRSTTTLNAVSKDNHMGSERSSLNHLSLVNLRSSASATVQIPDEAFSNVLQYGPDTSMPATSWPHSDWLALTSILAQVKPTFPSSVEDRPDDSPGEIMGLSVQMREKPIPMSYRKDAGTGSKDPLDTMREHAKSSTGMVQSSERPSDYHVVSLSNFLSLVVIVKPSDSELGKFLRRRARLPDEEIRSFLNDVAENLRVSSQFTVDCLPKADSKNRKMKFLLLGLPDVSSLHFGNEIHVVLKQVKKNFGLRPGSPFQEKSIEKSRSFALLTPRRKDRSWTKENDDWSSTFAKSAVFFFFGDQLANLVDME